MNNYALAADSRRWWLPSAVAGAIGAVALAVILILPTSGHPAPETPDGSGASVPANPGVGHSCFMHRPPRVYGVDDLPACH
jgi:hypothetical protein